MTEHTILIRRSAAIAVLLVMGLFSVLAWAEEESLDLDAVPSVPMPHPSSSGLKLMGRVDLTGDLTEANRVGGADSLQLRNYHFLLFLKAAASPKVGFFGEFVRQSFYEIKYEPWNNLSFRWGKLLVPFGNTDQFHHLHGGVSVTSAGRGVMFKNIWAAPGMHAEWEAGTHSTLDAYLVSGINAASTSADPDLQSPQGKSPAVGLRWTRRLGAAFKLQGSGYYEHWAPGRELYLVGLDATTPYKLIDVPLLRNIRLAVGAAAGFIQGASGGSFHVYGDYLELYSNSISAGEIRTRLGTYLHDSRTPSVRDSHSLSVAWLMPIDAMRLCVEYQLNFEAVNEIDNDLLRVMISIDL